MPFWISIHTFLTEGDTGYHTCRCIFWYFNPHLPYGRWLGDTEMCWHCREFQSTPSLQKVTQGKRNKTAIAKFQSTPSLQKVTATYFACIKRLSISIHTFLAEGDSSRLQMLFAKMDFNPHLPCRRWRKQDVGVESYTEFQSTPSSRKVTQVFFHDCKNFVFQSTPSSRKVTLRGNLFSVPFPFQSTPSSRKVTLLSRSGLWCSHNFNPHLPRGRWHVLRKAKRNIRWFQSTPSSRKVT